MQKTAALLPRFFAICEKSWCGQNEPPPGRRLNAYFDSHFSSTGSQQQQEKWDGRPNSPVVSANCDMNLIPVFNGHVRNVGEVSTYGSSKLKTFNAQGKRWQVHTTHNNTRKCSFSTLVQHRVPQDRKRRAVCFLS